MNKQMQSQKILKINKYFHTFFLNYEKANKKIKIKLTQ